MWDNGTCPGAYRPAAGKPANRACADPIDLSFCGSSLFSDEKQLLLQLRTTTTHHNTYTPNTHTPTVLSTTKEAWQWLNFGFLFQCSGEKVVMEIDYSIASTSTNHPQLSTIVPPTNHIVQHSSDRVLFRLMWIITECSHFSTKECVMVLVCNPQIWKWVCIRKSLFLSENYRVYACALPQ